MASRTRPRLSLESAQEAYREQGGRCWCGMQAREWHHVFSQQKWPELADDSRNVIAVCASCHSRHTLAMSRLPRSVCERAEALITGEKMRAYLERTYG